MRRLLPTRDRDPRFRDPRNGAAAGEVQAAIEADNGQGLGGDELVRLIAAKVDNDSSMVIVTGMLGTLPYDRPGKWGVDEPGPY